MAIFVGTAVLAQQTATPVRNPQDAKAFDHGVPSAVHIRVIPPVVTSVEVNAEREGLIDGVVDPYNATRSDVMDSAGTFQDFTRFLTILPGVVWNSDQSNDVMVRGGHPSENLYVVDGIEIPNINHIAVEGTTGGFTSMIDTSSVDSVDMKAGVYDAKYSSHLSSLIDIHTRDSHHGSHAGQFNLGIAGAGGFLERPIGPNIWLFATAHRSLLNLVTNNIGLNGTPTYTNGMGRLEWTPNDKDSVSMLSLSGVDSININPCAGDVTQTLDINTQYAGWRSTAGLVWLHTHSASTVSTLTGSFSKQNQDIGQQQQQTGGQYHNFDPKNHCRALVTTDIYKEKTNDGISTLNYGLQMDRHGVLISIGASGKLTSLDYGLNEPVGEQSPFNPSPIRTDANSFARNFSTGQSAVYAEATGHIGQRLSAMVGAREETFSLLHAHLFEPRASMTLRLNGHQTVSAEYGRSSQLPSYMNILSYSQNSRLKPVGVEQYSVGADLWRASRATVSMQAFHKRYFDEPVSTQYSGLMLANMVDTLGQAFTWLPLKTGGHGNSEGLELLIRGNLPKRLEFLGSATYARSRYAAADGVLRPGNFDVPLVANALATAWLPGLIQLNFRDTYATGRPYTPFLLSQSRAQFRGIYDLTRINVPRGPAYNRLDIEVSRNFKVYRGLLNVRAGVDNILDRKNFLGYVWLSRCPVGAKCSATGTPMEAVYQMPLLPAVGMRYDF